MNDEQLRQAYARHVAQRRPDRRDGCPSPEALLAVVERAGSETSRLATLDHAMACEACRQDLELLRAAAAAGQGDTSAVPRARFAGGPARLASAAAILVAFGVLATLTLRREHGSIFRSNDDLVLVTPVGLVTPDAAVTLTWRRASGATLYEVEVLSAAGDSVFTASTSDTTMQLPASTVAEAREYVWSVRARLSDGSQAAAAPRRFTVRQP